MSLYGRERERERARERKDIERRGVSGKILSMWGRNARNYGKISDRAFFKKSSSKYGIKTRKKIKFINGVDIINREKFGVSSK